MPFKIVRNDITKMRCDAIVNTANTKPIIGSGCDYAVYKAAGKRRLSEYREKNIGEVPEGDVFLTPGFRLPAHYIIHAVSPHYIDGAHGEEEKLRDCYRKSLSLAWKQSCRSIAFPVISTGSFGYPKQEGIRIAADEIQAFLQNHEMLIYLVVFDAQSARYGKRFDKDLQAYIDENYVDAKHHEEYGIQTMALQREQDDEVCRPDETELDDALRQPDGTDLDDESFSPYEDDLYEDDLYEVDSDEDTEEENAFTQLHESKLEERMKHLTDSFSEYLLYLIEEKGMTNADVYKRALVDKKTFSKIKNHAEYHPQKMTAMCLCMGAKLNLDETRDLLARAGYALSPCDKTDIIFSYFIENQIYDMIELDIQLEEHGLSCLI
jgi:O-acetyl-ADP-ribose deacetylase (regulator of RNase III)/predicted CopG family antitoxin